MMFLTVFQQVQYLWGAGFGRVSLIQSLGKPKLHRTVNMVLKLLVGLDVPPCGYFRIGVIYIELDVKNLLWFVDVEISGHFPKLIVNTSLSTYGEPRKELNM